MIITCRKQKRKVRRTCHHGSNVFLNLMNDDFASDGRKVESLGFVCEIYTKIYVIRGKTGRNISFALGVDGSVRKIRNA